MGPRLLLVEDDPGLVRALADLFGSTGYVVRTINDGAEALEAAATQLFDLIILDVMLPNISGIEVCRQLRGQRVATPILMLAARDQIRDKVAGLESGADDYVTKPFDMDELRARVEALIRRTSRTGRIELLAYDFGDVRVNFAKLEITRGDWKGSLSERECRLLRYFIEHRGLVISRDTLLEQVWGYNTAPNTRTVDVHILHLRQKIEEDPKKPRYIVTVHGLGYRFDG